jgi:hypothetical protein
MRVKNSAELSAAAIQKVRGKSEFLGGFRKLQWLR